MPLQAEKRPWRLKLLIKLDHDAPIEAFLLLSFLMSSTSLNRRSLSVGEAKEVADDLEEIGMTTRIRLWVCETFLIVLGDNEKRSQNGHQRWEVAASAWLPWRKQRPSQPTKEL